MILLVAALLVLYSVAGYVAYRLLLPEGRYRG